MKVTTGKRVKPLAIMAYGIHGIGKTSFPLKSEKPIYIGSEENDEFDIARLPKIETWNELEEQLKFLLKNDHGYKTLVIDTIDTLEQIAQKEILKGQSGKTMATAFGGFGKAYEKMHDMFLDMRDEYLVKLRDQKGMNIVILCHAEKNKHEDPMTATSYDNYSTALHKKIKHVFEDWVSAIVFITWQLFKAEGGDGKERAVGDGTRVIYTEERPSHIAKNRFGLPFEIIYDEDTAWKEIYDHIKDYYGQAKAADKKPESPEVDQVKKAINELMPKLDEDTKGKISLSVERAGNDIQELNRIYSKMQKLTK
jgi:hypothetical protein